MREKNGKQDKERKDLGGVEPIVYKMYPNFDKYSDQDKNLLLEQIRESGQHLMDRSKKMRYPDYEKFPAEEQKKIRKQMEERKQDLKQRCHNWTRLAPWMREMLLAGIIEPKKSDLLTDKELREIAKREKESVAKTKTKLG